MRQPSVSTPITVVSLRGMADALIPYEQQAGPLPAPHDASVDMYFLGAEGTFRRWGELNGCTGPSSAADTNGCSVYWSYSSCPDDVEVALCGTEGGSTGWGDVELGWTVLSRHSLPQ